MIVLLIYFLLTMRIQRTEQIRTWLSKVTLMLTHKSSPKARDPDGARCAWYYIMNTIFERACSIYWQKLRLLVTREIEILCGSLFFILVSYWRTFVFV